MVVVTYSNDPFGLSGSNFVGGAVEPEFVVVVEGEFVFSVVVVVVVVGGVHEFVLR